MKTTTIHSSMILLLASCGLHAAPESIFVGIPTVRVVASGTNPLSKILTAKEKDEYVCRIVADDGRLLWASRENKELIEWDSFAYTFYMAKDGSGLIKVVKDKTIALQDYDYFEQLSLGLTTFTYWGERGAKSGVQALQKRINESELAREGPELSRFVESMKAELLALENTSGALLTAYNELDLNSAKDGALEKGTLEQIRKLRTASDALSDALEKSEQRFNSLLSTLKTKLSAEQLNWIMTGAEMMKALAVAGNAAARCAALYVVSSSEGDRLKLIKAGTDFEGQWEAILKRGQENHSKLESLLKSANERTR